MPSPSFIGSNHLFMTHQYTLHGDDFKITGFNSARPFSSFLPGIAGEFGKPLWVFYTNRGQCVSSFGVRDRNGAMLEFHPANKAYALTPLLGFRTFVRLKGTAGPALYEPFQNQASADMQQHLTVRPHEIEIQETHDELGLRIHVVYFTLPSESLPALVRRVTVQNIGRSSLQAQVMDGLPAVVAFGLEEKLLKSMSRTMEAFAEIRHVQEQLPFFKLKVEPSDKPEVQWIEGGFFAFTVQHGVSVPVTVDPDQVFGSDTSLRSPLAFLHDGASDVSAGRTSTLTGCAFAQLNLSLAPGEITVWDSCFGQANNWEHARALRERVIADATYGSRRRGENAELTSRIGSHFGLIAGPKQLDPYTRQAFLDNTLRGGQPVVIDGPHGPRVFHAFTRKHGDMERDYNAFQLAPTYFSQGNANFRDVNQNRRSENFLFPGVGASNIETFFNLMQIDGNNPLVIESEIFRLPGDELEHLMREWPAGDTREMRALLDQPYSPGDLAQALIAQCGTPDMARPWFDRIVGHSNKIQNASHGEGYWVDHWIYNLDLLDSFAALYPDRMGALLLAQCESTFYDSEYVVLARARKHVLRKDGSVRQLHAVVQDAEKTRMIASRSEDPHLMRTAHGTGPIYRTTLLAKIVSLMVLKASLFDPFGSGLEMEAEKPGWCDALNGLPGLLGSSTHEAYALQRCARFLRACLHAHLTAPATLALPTEVGALLFEVTHALEKSEHSDFTPSWDRLAGLREQFRAQTRLGIAGTQMWLSGAEIAHFLDALDRVLDTGLTRAVDDAGLPVSYFSHQVLEFDLLVSTTHGTDQNEEHTQFVHARRFARTPVAPFLEGAVQALRCTTNVQRAHTLYQAVRASLLYDVKLGMYRVNAPLDAQSYEIGRSRIFTPGWLENESIFLHMHYKYLLETLRMGLAAEFFDDLRRGLVAFQRPEVYGRSPLENSSFIASSRFPHEATQGVGFVARLSGATAEWISMVLHMGLGAAPFQMVDGALRFAPRPILAGWLFTTEAIAQAGAGSFGFKLFGKTWIVYDNPARCATFGVDAVAPVGFDLHHADGRIETHRGSWLPVQAAHALRDGALVRLVIRLA